MNYHVGQVLFVVLNKKSHIYPMLVIEEITKKTLRGEETTYVLLGGSDPSSRLMFDQIDGDVFESADIARNVLISRATDQIEKLVNAAIMKAEEWYSTKVKNESRIVHELPTKVEDQQVVKLPDGTLARIKLSETA